MFSAGHRGPAVRDLSMMGRSSDEARVLRSTASLEARYDAAPSKQKGCPQAVYFIDSDRALYRGTPGSGGFVGAARLVPRAHLAQSIAGPRAASSEGRAEAR